MVWDMQFAALRCRMILSRSQGPPCDHHNCCACLWASTVPAGAKWLRVSSHKYELHMIHMSFMLNTMAWYRCLRPHVYIPGCCFWSHSKCLTLDLTWQAPFVTGSRRTGRTVSGAAIALCRIKARVHTKTANQIAIRHLMIQIVSYAAYSKLLKCIHAYSSYLMLFLILFHFWRSTHSKVSWLWRPFSGGSSASHEIQGPQSYAS